jgi:hypothetical protein
MKLAAFAAVILAVASLPDGDGQLRWGISVNELQKSVPVQKVEGGHGFGYAEHMEVNPDVYVQKSDGQKHREFYFHRGKLYKMFSVYDRTLTSVETYQKLLDRLRKEHGAPTRTFEENVMGIRVIHNEWSDDKNTLDLRLGAGFIYEVRTDNAAAREKQAMQQLKHSI